MVVTRLARRLRQQGESAASPTQLAALATIERDGPLTLGELSHVENVRPPTLTKVVAALEEQGLVERHVDPSDRRVSLVRLTTEGREVIDAAAALLVEADFGALAGLEDDRRELFCDLLDELRQESEAPAEPRA